MEIQGEKNKDSPLKCNQNWQESNRQRNSTDKIDWILNYLEEDCWQFE